MPHQELGKETLSAALEGLQLQKARIDAWIAEERRMLGGPYNRYRIRIELPLMKLQMGKPERQTMNVEVRVGSERQVLKVGEIAEFKQVGLSVGLIGSIAYEGAQASVAEGNPYAIDLIAWRRRQ